MALRTGPTSVGEEAITLEDVAAPGLVSQRLGQVARLCLHLVEQADVLDRDHGLVGESLYQLDLALRKLSVRTRASANMPTLRDCRSRGTNTIDLKPHEPRQIS